MQTNFIINETMPAEAVNWWDQLTELPVFNDPIAFALVAVGVALSLVLIVMGNITSQVGKGFFPKAFQPNPKPKKETEEGTVIKALTSAVPVEEEGEILMDHEYDGIQELDNDLPPWWKYGFFLSIIWGVIYLIYFHVSSFGPSSHEEFVQQVQEGKEEVAAYRATLKEIIDETTVTALMADGHIEAGELIYKKNCFPCHGMEGQGANGPNLTDKYWIHGGGIKNIFKTIKYGVAGKGMAAWNSKLSPKEMQKVASYILTLEGSNPDNAKAPQGDLWEGETTEE